MKLRIRKNLVGGLMMAAVAAVVLALIPQQIQVSTLLAEEVDAAFMPRAICIIILILSLWQVVESLIKKKDEIIEIDLGSEAWAIGYFAMLVLLVVLTGVIGMLPASLLFGIGTMLYLNCKKWQYYVVIVVSFVLLYFAFTQLLKIPLPGFGGA